MYKKLPARTARLKQKNLETGYFHTEPIPNITMAGIVPAVKICVRQCKNTDSLDL